MESEVLERVDSLHLHILKCKCTACQNEWKHSNLWLASKEAGYLGGTPDSNQLASLRVLSMDETEREYPSCFRCIPLELGKCWISSRDLELARARASRAAKTEDLLA